MQFTQTPAVCGHNSRLHRWEHDKVLRKARKKCREPAEVPFRAGYSGPLRGPYPASSARPPFRSRKGPAPLLSAGSAWFSIRCEFSCIVQRRSSSKLGGGWGRRVIGDQPDRPHKLIPARERALAGTISLVPRRAKHSLPLARP